MTDQLDEALDRLTRAVDRVETASRNLPDRALPERHGRLRAEMEDAAARLDRLIGTDPA